MVISQTIPLIALAPLVIIWFGFGIAPKIVLVALFTFFATAVGTVQGLASADPDAMNLLRTMGASRAPAAVAGAAAERAAAVLHRPEGLGHLRLRRRDLRRVRRRDAGPGLLHELAQHGDNTDLVFGAVIVTALLTLVAVRDRRRARARRPALAPAARRRERVMVSGARPARRGARLEDLRRRRRAAAARRSTRVELDAAPASSSR